MSEIHELPVGFVEHVTPWLREKLPASAEFIGIDEYGTDWAGDTYGGFYPEFELTIRYRNSEGAIKTWDVKGEDLASLWQWVVGGWPSPSEEQQ
jgi:hypothetical protein